MERLEVRCAGTGAVRLLTKSSLCGILCACVGFASASHGAEYRFRVLRPDGTPIANFGLQIEHESVQYTHGPDVTGRAWTATGPDGVAVFEMEDSGTDELLRVEVIPSTSILIRSLGKQKSREIHELMVDLLRTYSFDDVYLFTPTAVDEGEIGVIQLPPSVQARISPTVHGEPVSSVVLWCHDRWHQKIPRLLDEQHGASIPIVQGQAAVVYLFDGAHVRRIAIPAEQTLSDFDLGKVALDTPGPTTTSRIQVTRPGWKQCPITLVSSDGSVILHFVTDQQGQAVEDWGLDDPMALSIPPNEYIVFRYLVGSRAGEDYDVPAAIERVVAGEDPGIAHTVIEIGPDKSNHFQINISEDGSEMTAVELPEEPEP
jgi:hypothetical protein